MQCLRNPFGISKGKAHNSGGDDGKGGQRSFCESDAKQLRNAQGFNADPEKKSTSAIQEADDRCAAEDVVYNRRDVAIQGNEQTLVSIPGAVVHLVDGDEQSVELERGEFSIVRLSQGTTGIGLFVKVGERLRWPLTKDEPTVKVDSLHYLFSLEPPPATAADGDDPSGILNYGVTFPSTEQLEVLDKCLEQYACFSVPSPDSPSVAVNTEAFWTTLAPRVEDYNSVLAKAIAAGTGRIIKGIFYCSNAYSSQILKGGDQFARGRGNANNSKTKTPTKFNNPDRAISISPRTKRNIRRVKKLSRMMENLSGNVLAGAVTASGAVSGSVIKSKAGQKLFAMLPGEVLLASLDAFNKVLDAAEVAGKNALSTTSEVTTGIVADRFGEDAADVTHDGLKVVGHVAGTAWNIAKIRKAINPAANGTISSTVVRNSRKAKATAGAQAK